MKIWKLGIDFKDFKSYMRVDRDEEKCEELSSYINSGKKNNNVFDGDEIAVYEGSVKADFSHIWDISGNVLSEKAKNVLKDVLKDNVELIVMQAEEEELYLMNVFNLIDALDYELSEISYGPSGLALAVKKYVFKPDVVKENDIFNIYLKGRVYGTNIFVSDKFKKIVEENNLTGFSFTEVWEG